ncbi:uncharacterized protein CANTADRAFT_27597 [Suhomyces tanzawaensis NRRL Y-17324]|uniref:Uncharacterized protein n=1 Tax=Suhomyces tanzawaensis NRRL Y-17324 TaxID=984487 RepID=A0A1E4SBJ4_9ASCO|nr:uncharacterized protein CANTADRAFT_27597 [Suhomyces tanzawaensis NRRL Y-17324]ODV76836.1 hypothetical protein CANTADRAFT_27597 [Suhomyces tanzawaensis NRRL Y-17324]
MVNEKESSTKYIFPASLLAKLTRVKMDSTQQLVTVVQENFQLVAICCEYLQKSYTKPSRRQPGHGTAGAGWW